MNIALVTGASRGIGRQTARRLVEEGLTVYAGVRNVEDAASSVEEIGAHAIQLDITDDASVAAAVKTIAAEHGHLDVLVNNAGVQGPMVHPREQSIEQMEAVFGTNVIGTVRVTTAFIDLLEKSDSPVIVNISSGTGSLRLTTDPSRLEGTLLGLAYPSSKAALNMLTSQWAKALPWARVNAADPGSTQTDMNGGRGQHTLEEGSEVGVKLALIDKNGPTGTFSDVTGPVPW